MATLNEYSFLETFFNDNPDYCISGSVLDVGSASYEEKISYAPLLYGREVVGVDLLSREGVDVVCDMTGDCKELQERKFALVLCCSTLEHCAKPWLMASNIEQHLLPGGMVYVTVPWVWRTHNYPKDYWRMSPDAVRILFPHIHWDIVAHSTQQKDEFLPEGYDHDNNSPWRGVYNNRAYIVVQMVHMIGKLA